MTMDETNCYCDLELIKVEVCNPVAPDMDPGAFDIFTFEIGKTVQRKRFRSSLDLVYPISDKELGCRRTFKCRVCGQISILEPEITNR